MFRFFTALLTMLLLCSRYTISFAQSTLPPPVALPSIVDGLLDYKYISSSGTTQTYLLTLTLYVDCAAKWDYPSVYDDLLGAVPEIRLYKNGYLNKVQRLKYDASRSNIMVMPVCPKNANSTTCTDDFSLIPGVTKFVYTGEITVPGTDANWIFEFRGRAIKSYGDFFTRRSLLDQNMYNPSTNPTSITYLTATLNNAVGLNNSPVFASLPIAFFSLNKPSTYNILAKDPDNDQLAFSLISAKTVFSTTAADPPINAAYLAPFTALSPLPVSPGTFNLNANTGKINFTPNEVKSCLATVLVQEFRNGTLVGSTIREITFFVDSSDNREPLSPISAIKHASLAEDLSDQLSLNTCEGQTEPISFDVKPIDPDGHNITVSYFDLPAGSNISIDSNGTQSPKMHFTWNAIDAPAGDYTFYISYTDDHCPYVSSKLVAYTIRVIPHSYEFFGGTTGACRNQTDGTAWIVPESGLTLDYSYRWVNAAGETLQQTNSTNGDTLRNLPVGVYKVYARNNDGCGKNIEIKVEEIPEPEVLLPPDTTVCAAMPIKISNMSKHDMTYLWNTGDTTCCITASTGGVYTLKASNLCGSKTGSMRLNHVKCNFCLFAPNAFSPNGDGHNDKFIVLETCMMEKYLMQIYNRWGQLLFTTLSSGNGWNGTYNGQEVESGTYYYRISAIPTDKSKGNIELRGSIEVIR